MCPPVKAESQLEGAWAPKAACGGMLGTSDWSLHWLGEPEVASAVFNPPILGDDPGS